MPRAARWLLPVLAAGGAAAAAPEAAPVSVAVDWFSCSSGRYALTLPQHYPSLRVIGRHQVQEIDVQSRADETLSHRRLSYHGLKIEVLVSSRAPQQYRMLSVDSISRRWNIGRLSVGTSPWWWPWSREKEIANLTLDGPIRLVGGADSVTMWLSKGRIDRVLYRCGSTRRDA